MNSPIGTAIFVMSLFWVLASWPLYVCPSSTDPWKTDAVCMQKVDAFLHNHRSEKK